MAAGSQRVDLTWSVSTVVLLVLAIAGLNTSYTLATTLYPDAMVAPGRHASFAFGDFDENGRLELLAFARDWDDNNWLSVAPLAEDGSFEPPAVIDQPVRDLVLLGIADCDLDGHEDVLSVAYTGDLELRFGRGDGTFELSPTGSSAGERALIADLNGDRLPDIVAMGESYDEWFVIFGQPGRTFGARLPLGASGHGSDVALCDLDGDEAPDILMSIPAQDTILGVAVRGAGDVRRLFELHGWARPGPITGADLNGDGLCDPVTLSGDGDISYALSIGPGVYGPTESLSPGAGSRVRAADLDADGDLDLVAFGATTLAYISDGHGRFDGPVVSQAGEGLTDADLMDLNRDGLLDLVVANPLGVYALLAVGVGQFGRRTMLPTEGGGSFLYVGDFDGDHRPDLAAIHGEYPTLTIMEGQGSGAFSPGASVSGVDGLSFTTASVFDFDADGRDDIVTKNAVTGGLEVLFSDGPGGFRQVPLEGPQELGSVAVLDFNQDGRLDLAASGTQVDAPLTVFLGTGAGSFGPPLTSGGGCNARSLQGGDFNGDSIRDLVGYSFLSDSACIWMGQGDGQFDAPLVIRVNVAAESMTVADFNEDGRDDVAVTGTFEGTAAVLLSTTSGSFQLRYIVAGTDPMDIASADMDNDGHIDLLTMGGHGVISVAVHFGLGNGLFQPEYRPASVLDSGIRWPMLIADIDNDGDADVVISRGPAVRVLLNDGVGGLQDFREFLVPGRNRIVIGDFDSDTRPDLAVASVSPDGVQVLLNQGGNHRPVAHASAPRVVECSSREGATVVLDGSASSDTDSAPGTHGAGDIVAYEWFSQFGTPSEFLIGSGPNMTTVLGLGEHHVTLRVIDRQGSSALAQVTIAIQDRTPPSLVPRATPNLLWPPNNSLSAVSIDWSAVDVCDPNPMVQLVSVRIIDEPSNARSRIGPSVPDVVDADLGEPDHMMLLRASRQPGSHNRTYGLEYAALDASGNATAATAIVLVSAPPHAH